MARQKPLKSPALAIATLSVCFILDGANPLHAQMPYQPGGMTQPGAAQPGGVTQPGAASAGRGAAARRRLSAGRGAAAGRTTLSARRGTADRHAARHSLPAWRNQFVSARRSLSARHRRAVSAGRRDNAARCRLPAWHRHPLSAWRDATARCRISYRQSLIHDLD